VDVRRFVFLPDIPFSGAMDFIEWLRRETAKTSVAWNGEVVLTKARVVELIPYPWFGTCRCEVVSRQVRTKGATVSA